MHPNAQLVIEGFQAFGQGDPAAMGAVLHDDAVWHNAGDHRFAGDHRGPEAIARQLQELASIAAIEARPHDVLASDDHVVVLVDFRATRGDQVVVGQLVVVCHVDDGKISEAWSIPYDQAAENAFWG